MTNAQLTKILRSRFNLRKPERARLAACIDLPRILKLVRYAAGTEFGSDEWYTVKLLMHKHKIFNCDQ